MEVWQLQLENDIYIVWIKIKWDDLFNRNENLF